MMTASVAAVAATAALAAPAVAAKAGNSVDCSDLSSSVNATWVGGTQYVQVDYRTAPDAPYQQAVRRVHGKGSLTVDTPGAVDAQISFIHHNGGWDTFSCSVG
jgi:hypothetical protein